MKATLMRKSFLKIFSKNFAQGKSSALYANGLPELFQQIRQSAKHVTKRIIAINLEEEVRKFDQIELNDKLKETQKLKLYNEAILLLLNVRYNADSNLVLLCFKISQYFGESSWMSMKILMQHFLMCLSHDNLREFYAFLQEMSRLIEKEYEKRKDFDEEEKEKILNIELNRMNLSRRMGDFFKEYPLLLKKLLPKDLEIYLEVFDFLLALFQKLKKRGKVWGANYFLRQSMDEWVKILSAYSSDTITENAAIKILNILLRTNVYATFNDREEALQFAVRMLTKINLQKNSQLAIDYFVKFLNFQANLGVQSSELFALLPGKRMLAEINQIGTQIQILKQLSIIKPPRLDLISILLQNIQENLPEIKILLGQRSDIQDSLHISLENLMLDPVTTSLAQSTFKEIIILLRVACYMKKVSEVKLKLDSKHTEGFDLSFHCTQEKSSYYAMSARPLIRNSAADRHGSHPFESFIEDTLKEYLPQLFGEGAFVLEFQKNYCIYNVDYYIYLPAQDIRIVMELYGNEYINANGELLGLKASKFEYIEKTGALFFPLEIDQYFYDLFFEQNKEKLFELLRNMIEKKFEEKQIKLTSSHDLK